jgi:hypothetical protein
MTQTPNNPSGVAGTTSAGTDYGPTSSEVQYGTGTDMDYDATTGHGVDVAGVDPSSGPTATPYHEGGQGMKDTVKAEASSVAEDAKERGKDVAGTAAEEAKDVAREVKSQLLQLLDQFRGEATTQASDQSKRAARGLMSLGSELNQMASSAPSDGVAGDLVRQAADRVRGAAEWFDNREPGELLDDVRDFARRRPGAFLAGAAVLGILGGRLTRGLTADSSTAGGAQGSTARGSYPAASGAYAGTGSAGVYSDTATAGAYSDTATAGAYSDTATAGAYGDTATTDYYAGGGSSYSSGAGGTDSDLESGLATTGTSAATTDREDVTKPGSGTGEGVR